MDTAYCVLCIVDSVCDCHASRDSCTCLAHLNLSRADSDSILQFSQSSISNLSISHTITNYHLPITMRFSSPLNQQAYYEQVWNLVRQIPRGKVMTYGQMSALAGHPRRARIVGQIAHYGDPDLPWQRVVNRNGRMAPGFPGGMMAQADMLRAENIEVDDQDWTCDLDRHLWWPKGTKP